MTGKFSELRIGWSRNRRCHVTLKVTVATGRPGYFI